MSVILEFFEKPVIYDHKVKKEDYDLRSCFLHTIPDRYIICQQEWKDFNHHWMRKELTSEDMGEGLQFYQGDKARDLYQSFMMHLPEVWRTIPGVQTLPGWWYIEKEKYRLVDMCKVTYTDEYIPPVEGYEYTPTTSLLENFSTKELQQLQYTMIQSHRASGDNGETLVHMKHILTTEGRDIDRYTMTVELPYLMNAAGYLYDLRTNPTTAVDAELMSMDLMKKVNSLVRGFPEPSQFRKHACCNLQGNTITAAFIDAANIYPELEKCINRFNFSFTFAYDISQPLAEFMLTFLAIHPFPDGNGRTIKLLVCHIIESVYPGLHMSFPSSLEWAKLLRHSPSPGMEAKGDGKKLRRWFKDHGIKREGQAMHKRKPSLVQSCKFTFSDSLAPWSSDSCDDDGDDEKDTAPLVCILNQLNVQ